MQEFFPEIEIREDHAEAIARGLMAIAKADGEVHPREGAMIEEFFVSVTDRPTDLGRFEHEDAIEPEILAAQLPGDDLRQLFLKTAYLLGYADGNLGKGESELLGKYASAMGVGDDQLAELEQQVKEYMLAQLSHLSNIDAIAEVAKELKV